MTTEFIIGSFLTIVFGIVGVFVSIKITKKTSLQYYIVNPGSIFTKNHKEISKLKVEYDGKEITDEILFLRLLIINDGSNDIDKNTIYEPLKIKFKETVKIIEIFEENQSSGIHVKLEQNTIVCSWDLLKSNESFILKIAIEYEPDPEGKVIKTQNFFYNLLKITCRITNLKSVKRAYYRKPIDEKPKKGDLVLYGFILCMIFSLNILFLIKPTFGLSYIINDNGHL